MRRAWLLLVLLPPALPAVALAQKGSAGGKSYSGGGKSYSSGGGKSYSSGGSKSYSSSSSSSKGKSYSSRSTSRPSSSSSSSRPSSSSSSSSRPSSASAPASRPSSGATPARPGGSSYDAAAAAAAKRAESRSAYERRTSPNVPVSPGGPVTAPRNTPAGRSYSERNTRPGPATPTYRPGPAPRTDYSDVAGRPRPLDANDPRVGQVRRELNEDRWLTRPQRSRDVFVNVAPPTGYPVVVYQDPYSNLFWWWLLSHSLDYRASWAYHHRHGMDPLRYRDLLERDRALEARVRELEAKQVARDPTYTPPGVDPDLMYADPYVEAAVNPMPVHTTSAQPAGSSGGFATFLRSCFTFLLAVGVILFLIWFVFIKRWGGSAPAPGR